MSNPEMGLCSPEDYEGGKVFIVKPERLCVDGIYTLACKFRPLGGGKAQLHPARVEEITKIEDDHNASHVAYISLADEHRPTSYANGAPYLIDYAGFVRLPTDAQSLVEEAYLRHRFEGPDEELKNINSIETVEFRVETVPFVMPRSH